MYILYYGITQLRPGTNIKYSVIKYYSYWYVSERGSNYSLSSLGISKHNLRNVLSNTVE